MAPKHTGYLKSPGKLRKMEQKKSLGIYFLSANQVLKIQSGAKPAAHTLVKTLSTFERDYNRVVLSFPKTVGFDAPSCDFERLTVTSSCGFLASTSESLMSLFFQTPGFFFSQRIF